MRLLNFCKKGRNRRFLGFFRKNSALVVVVITAGIIIVGNVDNNKNRQGLLLGYFEKELENQDKIKSRVENHFKQNQNNLLMAPLAMASSLSEDEGIEVTMLSDDELKVNQSQFQVLTASTPPNAEELLDDGADVAVYLVKEGDSVSTIADKFGITINTILWANDIENASLIQPGDKIFILPVAGLKYVVEEGDTVKKIAKDYKADEKEIIKFNELPANGAVKSGQELIIPGGEKEEPQALFQERNYYSSGVAASGRAPSVIDRNPKGGHTFPYGYCTWFVAQHKYVPWSGNAGTWLYNARAYGAKTGKTPKVGSIIVTSESWYGHVGIVEKVHSNGSITIEEMNYKGFAVTSKRTINSKSRVIKGYIY